LRNASTHAAGVVIGDRPLDELVPLYRDPRSDMPATQFNMKWVEPAGLVKFDFLGLKTLTVIQNAVDLIHGRRAAARSRTDIYESRSINDPARRGDLRALCLGQDGRGVPGGKLGHDGRAAAHAADLHRGHRRARRALPARPDGEHPEILRRQERAERRATRSTR
jgi:hypothetical protein